MLILAIINFRGFLLPEDIVSYFEGLMDSLLQVNQLPIESIFLDC